MSVYAEDLVKSLVALNEIADTLNRAVAQHPGGRSPQAAVKNALEEALARLVELMGLRTGWVFLKDPAAKSQWAGKGYTLAAHCNLPPALALHRASAWKGGCDCQGLCNRGALTAAYNEVRCSRLAEAKSEDRRGLAVHASAPLRSGDQVLGILNVAAPTWDSFTPEMLALLSNVGSQMGIAIERARLFDLLKERRIDEQAALLEFTNQLLTQPRLDDLMSSLVKEIKRLLQVDACALVMLGDEPGALEFVAASGWRNDPVAHIKRMPDSEFNIVSQAMAAQQPMLAEDLEEHVVPLFELEWLQSEGFRGYAVVPLIAESRAIAALMLNTRRPRLLDEDEMRLLQLMANEASIAIEGARLRQEELKRQRLEEELSLGKQIQLSMLPKSSPTAPGWEFVAIYQAARTVGGDFYDYFELPGQPQRLGILIADVADKGVPAALFMALSRTIIRTTALSGRGAAAALLRANQLIMNDSQSDLFLSAFYAILELENGRLLYANAGHNRPLCYRARDGRVQDLKARGTILGAFEDIQIEERRISLTPGDALLFYTDGVSEALDAQGEMFGTQRLSDVFERSASGSAQDVKMAIVDAYNNFTGDVEQSDDVTFIVVKRTNRQ